MVPVTKTFLPPRKEYEQFLESIWDTNQIANGGALHKTLSNSLKQFLNLPNIILTANGTLPIQLALKKLANNGEVITTPFSYVATTSAIVWENCKPVFVDINPEYLTIDENKIEEAITNKTTAILATHVFGNPCNVIEIEKIANKYNLKVIYDAAHAFGVQYDGRSIFSYGDVSTCSFHATKIFHTGEGGALIAENENLHQELFYMHNFGHDGTLEYKGLGINAKMNELQAAMGLAVLPYSSDLLELRRLRTLKYNETLNFNYLSKIRIRDSASQNFSYYPIIFQSENILLQVLKKLNAEKIYPRRYFYPSLNSLDYIDSSEMPNSDSISKRILCLPLYPSLELDVIDKISSIINNVLKL